MACDSDAGLTARQWREQCEQAREIIADLERRIEDNMEEACDQCMDRADAYRDALERIASGRTSPDQAAHVARTALEA